MLLDVLFVVSFAARAPQCIDHLRRKQELMKQGLPDLFTLLGLLVR